MKSTSYVFTAECCNDCKYIFICIIFVIFVTLNTLKGEWGVSPVQNRLFCACSFTSIVFLAVVRKKRLLSLSVTATWQIHPPKEYAYAQSYSRILFFLKIMDKSTFYMHSCEYIIFSIGYCYKYGT